MSTKTYDPISPRSVAFLGLGVMATRMAGHLAHAGHRVTVYKRRTGFACIGSAPAETGDTATGYWS